MHSIIMVSVGLGVLLACLGIARTLATSRPDAMKTAAKLFLPFWLAVALVNMWVGVTSAGYTVLQELPFLAIVFGVPGAAAGAVIWFLARK